MYGRFADDDQDLIQPHEDALKRLRARANEALLSDDEPALLAVGYEAVRWMENLPANNPRHFPSYLAFINKPSPLSVIFEDGLRRVFHKVRDLRANGVDSATMKQPNNVSELALWGPRGVGKSNGLRLLTLVPAVLFPENVVSVFIDYSAYPAETHSPCLVIRDALLCAGVHLDGASDLENALDCAKAKQQDSAASSGRV